jgi:PAT family beta-lactamase induction signal transducer AmpG
MAHGEPTTPAVTTGRYRQATWPAFAAGVRLYADWRMLVLVLLGAASGLPLALTAGTLGVWLTRVGIDKTTIGLLGAVALPYTLKFLWAPLVDRLRLPLLGPLLGRRRSWALLTQLALMAAIAAMALTDPVANPLLLAVFAFLVALASASQDIVLDAYRVEILDPPRYGAGAAVFVLGYRLGLLASGAGALYLADLVSWSAVYLVMAGALVVGVATVIACREPRAPTEPSAASLLEAVRGAVLAPLLDFARRPFWLAILLFVFCYKLGDALAGAMTNPFLVELGFTNSEIASVSKLYGFIATIAGLALGGYLIPRLGLAATLWTGGVLQLASNLVFALQAELGHHLGMLAVTIGVENFSGGIGTAALVAYLSGLCSLLYTATQYALLSALATAARTVLGTATGALADMLGWIVFFGLTAALAVPGLVLLAWLGRRALLRAPGGAAPAPD